MNGRFRSRWGWVDPHFPTVVLNRRDGMRHLATENAIWTETRPIRFESFGEFADATPPVPAVDDWGKQVMLCEENFQFPITGTEDPDWTERQRQRVMAFEQGKQLARNRGSMSRVADATTGFASIALFGTIAVIALLLALVVIDLRWGG